MAFKDYTTVDEVVKYLKKPFSRTGGVKKSESYAYHYTCFENLLSMLKSKTYRLSSPQLLNDQHEFNLYPKEDWEGLYLASFVGQEEESMAMWSMYGKKWEQAVKVAFRIDLFEREMLSNNKNYIKNGENIGIVTDNTDYFASVAYVKNNKNSRVLHCGTVANARVLKDRQDFPNQLIGFIKDAVWAYEKEVRFMVKIDQKESNKNYEKIAVDLTRESATKLWETIEITPSPRFTGDLEKKLAAVGFPNCSVKENKFKGLISNTDPCESCDNKKVCYAKK